MTRTRSRSASLALDLLGRIAREELEPGDAIDLQALCRRHGVSRTVVREALADLGGKGLVVARPKVGTLVAPRDQWNFLDPTLLALSVQHPGSGSLPAEAFELRRAIEPAIVRGAAHHASRDECHQVLHCLRLMGEAVATRDPPGCIEADQSLYHVLAEGCGNRLLASIDRALAAIRSGHRQAAWRAELPAVGGTERAQRRVSLLTRLGLAIARRDAERAAALAAQLVDADNERAVEHPGERHGGRPRERTESTLPAAAARDAAQPDHLADEFAPTQPFPAPLRVAA